MHRKYNICLLVIMTLMITNCHREKNVCAANEIELFSQSLNNDVIQGWIKGEKYMVYPYYMKFDILSDMMRSYYKSGDEQRFRENFWKKTNKSETEFNKLKSETNELYLDQFCEQLNKLSTCEKCGVIIRFSGISDEMFFVDIMNVFDIESKQLTKNFEFEEMRQQYYAAFVVLLNKDRTIDKVILTTCSAGL